MSILALGVSYRRASVELLERLAFSSDDLAKAYRHLGELDSVREGVILSTCNRVEVYAEVGSYHAGFLELKRFLADSRELDPDEFAEPLYSHYEEHAVEHLLGVAAGLDSMVLGEPQILTQVRQAYRRADAEGAVGATLSAMFRGAIRTGRRVRAETDIGASPAAFVEAGAGMAGEVLSGLARRSAVIVGAGGMAALAAAHLRERGIGRLQIVNRSPDRAERLAARSGAEHGGLDLLTVAVAQADLVVSSTGAVGTVLPAEAVREALSANGRVGRPLFVLDLAVPRDVDPAVADVPGVTLADIDDLAARGTAPAEEIDRAGAIVAEEAGRFTAWRRAARLAPVIRALRDRGSRIRAAELARMSPRLAGLSDREWEAVEALTEGIVAKLLHHPIVRLKDAQAGDGLAKAVLDLFGLEPDPEG